MNWNARCGSAVFRPPPGKISRLGREKGLDSILGKDLSAELGRAEGAFYRFAENFLDPWVPIQLGIIIVVLLVSIGLGGWAERRLEPWLREVHGKRRLLRFLALLLRRTRWIVAVLLLALALIVIRATTLPSNGAIVGLAAALIGAWVAISVVSRFIHNRSFARLIAWTAWIVVALVITGALDEVTSALESAAIPVGTWRISIYDVVQATLVVAIVLWVAVLLGNVVEQRVAANPDLTPSLRVLIGKLARIVLLLVAGAVALAALGIDVTALTFFSGALGLGIGFGLQKVVSNFVSGIIILLDKSIKPGDTISLGDTYGWIKALRARFVSVSTRDGRSYLIPNEDFITQRVVNWSFTETLVRFDVEFGTSYGCDPHQVRRLAVEAAKGVDRVQERPPPVCHMTKMNDFSVDYILRFWITDPQNGVTNIKGAVLLAVWDAFKANGIEFPFPQQEITVKKPVDVQIRDNRQPQIRD